MDVAVVDVDDVEESDCGANCRSVFSIELNWCSLKAFTGEERDEDVEGVAGQLIFLLLFTVINGENVVLARAAQSDDDDERDNDRGDDESMETRGEDVPDEEGVDE